MLAQVAGLPRGHLDVRPYTDDTDDTDDTDEVRLDLKRSSLLVMPSRAEGFGLAAWEAISVGTPVLVSGQSGAAELLREHLGYAAERMVVDVVDHLPTDVRAWSLAIERTLDDQPAAFEHKRRVRDALVGRMTWSAMAQTLHGRVHRDHLRHLR